MKLFLDCLPCLLRQGFEAACMVTNKEEIQEAIMVQILEELLEYKNYDSAPELCQAIHLIVKEHSGISDPYIENKNQDISEALKLEPTIKEFFEKNEDLLLNALKISATGNVMDSALYSNLNIKSCVLDELEIPLGICDKEDLEKDLLTAKSILIIGDNAGEVVFDKILVEYLARNYRVFYALRESPIINDATLEDALKTGIENYAQLISTGCGMPGAVIKSCNKSFQELFHLADIIISKGQGNFEALSETKRPIYFLLKAKCKRIAEALDVEIGEYVFKKNK